MLWFGDRNIIKEDRRAGLTTECAGEVGTIGPIHLKSISLAPTLDVTIVDGLENRNLSSAYNLCLIVCCFAHVYILKRVQFKANITESTYRIYL